MQTGDVIGPWRLVRRLGVGGMGSVWEAVALDGGPPVALKLLLEPRVSSVHRFFDEARRGQALSHRNVVRVHDFGQHGEQVWLSMELLTGRTLASLLAVQRAPLPLGLVVALAAQALAGLEAVHRCFVHRDVKPSNLVLTDTGVLKLIDFGIALGGIEDCTHTRTGAFRGSLPYLAPEQAHSVPLDARADLFSFGLVLHELLTGTRVFNQTGEAAILTALLMQPIPSPRARRPGLPEALDALVMRALERNRDERYATTAEMAQALEACGLEEAPWEEDEIATWLATQPKSVPRAPVDTVSLEVGAAAPAGTASARQAPAPGTTAEALGVSTLSTPAAPAPGTTAGPGPGPLGASTPSTPAAPVRASTSRLAMSLVAVGLLAAAAGGIELARRRAPPVEPTAPREVQARPALEQLEGAATAPVRPPDATEVVEPGPSSDAGTASDRGATIRAVTAARPRASGFLTVDARPTFGRVSLDGTPVGLTPVALLPVSEGPHVVEVTRDDGVTRRRSLRIHSGAEVRWVVTW